MNEFEQICGLALSEFQKYLRANLTYPWEERHGHPPADGYIELRPYSTDFAALLTGNHAIQAWNITPDFTESLAQPREIPRNLNIDGMFFSLFIGVFGISADYRQISINWWTGPRFGRGFVHFIERFEGGAIGLGEGTSTWIS